MIITPSDIEKLGIFREEALGRIYEGNIRGNNRRVIVKELLLPPSLEKKTCVRLRMRFLEDAAALKDIMSPGITVPLSSGETNESAYVIFPLPPGIPMNSFLQSRGPQPSLETLQLFNRIVHCYKLLVSHGIHRMNVIPNDFFIEDNQTIHMVDTTLAVYDRASGLPSVGFLTGDRAFYAPEQIVMGKAGEQTLVFSLGLLLYWMLTGHPLYGGTSPFETLSQVLSRSYKSLPKSVDASTELYDLMRHLLQRDESLRFAAIEQISRSVDTVIERKRIERNIREQKDRMKVEKKPEPTEERPHTLRMVLISILAVVLVIFLCGKMKNWFFTGYEQMPSLSPSGKAMIVKAQDAIARGQWEDAVILSDHVLKISPDNPEANLMMGEAVYRLKEYEKAIPSLEKAKKSLNMETVFQASALLSEIYISFENYREADIQLERLVVLVPPGELLTEIENRRGQIFEKCFNDSREVARRPAEFESPVEDLETLGRTMEYINPTSEKIDFLHAMSAYLANDYDKAYTHMNAYCEAFPDDSLAHTLFRKIIQQRQ